MIDDEALTGPLGRIKFQPELLLYRGKDRRPSGLIRWSHSRTARSLVDRIFQTEIKQSSDPALIDNRTPQDESEGFGKLIDSRRLDVHPRHVRTLR
jgi:hypothetical protein